MLLRFKIASLLTAVLLCAASCQSQHQSRKAAAARWDKVSAQMKIPVAQQQFDTGKYADAAKTVSECLKSDPNLPPAHLLAGKIYFVQGQAQPAAKELEKALALEPKLDDGWYWLGIVCEDQKQFDKAAENYQKALALDGTNIDYILALARSYVNLNKDNDALALLQEKMQVLPSDIELKAKCADLLSRQKKYEQAILLYKQAVLLAPARNDISESLGYCCITARKWADASEIFADLASECTDNSKKGSYLQLLATCQLNAGQYGNALSTLGKLNSKEREKPQFWIQMGQASLGNGDAQRALICGRRALAIAPDNPEAISLKGSAEYLNKNYNDAIKSFAKIAGLPQYASFANAMISKCNQHLGTGKSADISQAQNPGKNAAF